MSAYEWRPDPKRPYRARFRGPVVLLGLRQDEVTTSADFDWKLRHRLYAEHVLDDHGAPQDYRVWQTTPPRPTDPSDRANWQSIVATGAPKWLGKGWGMKVAKSEQSCLFGGRFELMPNSTLGEIDAELRRLQPLIERMAAPLVLAESLKMAAGNSSLCRTNQSFSSSPARDRPRHRSPLLTSSPLMTHALAACRAPRDRA
jgi:hypothetical protein